jgi:phosphoserine phosphatase
MKHVTFFFFSVLGFVLFAGCRASDHGDKATLMKQAMQPSSDALIAIDVLLEPDQTMVSMANTLNARLRGDYPDGYSLDATHAPHVTLLQRFVRAKDLDAVTAAITKVLAFERPTDLQLKAEGLVYVVSAGVAVTLITVERTPALMRLQQHVVDAVAPLSVSGGTAAAFIDTPPGADIVPYVEAFVPKASGVNYFPHVTAGVATEAFVKALKAAPFDTFTFKPDGVAIYQLGNFGTASKRIWPSQAREGAQAMSGNPLASWNDGAAKQSILDFVRRVTAAGSPDFVPVPDRIAVFDNDGTLWPEQPPISFQGQFVFDRVRALAPQHADWRERQPFKGVIENDLKSVAAAGEAGLIEMALATHSGMTTDEFDRIVREWLATTRHPKFNRPYTDLAYQPMLELLAFLRANDFKTYIVSGGGVEFMRTFCERVYGIPPEQIIGSSIALKYEVRNGRPVLTRQPNVDFIDDKEGKPVGIQKFIGRRPIAAFGNSDGDFAMLEWATAGSGPRLGLLVHHTDAVREFAYDHGSIAGKLERGLDEAKARGWTLVDMARDWDHVFPFES